MLHVTPLHAAAGLVLSDVRCDGATPGLGPEEEGSGWDLVVPRHGSFACRSGAELALADPSRVLLLAPGRPYRFAHRGRCADRCTVLTLSRRGLDQLAAATRDAPLASGPVPARVAVALRRLAAGLGRRVVSALEADESCVALARELLAALGARAAQPGRPASERRRELAWEAQELLALRHAEPLTLEQLGRELGCSPFHLARVFRAETGTTLHACRLALRVAAALERIEQGERDLARLALDLGFADHAHLTRTLRAETGLPPSRLRAWLRASTDLQADG